MNDNQVLYRRPVFWLGVIAVIAVAIVVVVVAGGGDDDDGDEGASPAPEAARVEVLAYCAEANGQLPTITTADEVFITWEWLAASADFVNNHIAHAVYTVRLDGNALEGWEQYATDVAQRGQYWAVSWLYPAGRLAAGEHRVEYQLTWDDVVTDGYELFGPDTATPQMTGSCTFTVVAP